MSKRRINPATGEVELTYREEKLVDEYIKNGGNGKEAAIAAGYGAARADQSAYQVLRRAQVQQHIRDRISESRVSSEEIIGTLVSCMRGNLAQCLNADGDFDLKLMKKKRLGHLLKTISVTSRTTKGRNGEPPEVIRNYRVQLHSPLQAASILARLKGLHREPSPAGTLDSADQGPLDRANADPPGPFVDDALQQANTGPAGPTVDPLIPDLDPAHQASDHVVSDSVDRDVIARDFDPDALLESLIQHLMREGAMSRSAAVQLILQVRPEFALYLQSEPGTPTGPHVEAGRRDRSQIALDSGLPPSSDSDPDLHPAKEPVERCFSLPTQDSGLQTRDSLPAPHSAALSQPESERSKASKDQLCQPVSRRAVAQRDSQILNSTQCLSRPAPAPSHTQLDSSSPTETPAAPP